MAVSDLALGAKNGTGSKGREKHFGLEKKDARLSLGRVIPSTTGHCVVISGTDLGSRQARQAPNGYDGDGWPGGGATCRRLCRGCRSEAVAYHPVVVRYPGLQAIPLLIGGGIPARIMHANAA